MRKRLLIATLIAMAALLSACRKEMPVQEPLPEDNGSGWTVAIAATIGGDASTRVLTEDPVTHNLIASFETIPPPCIRTKTEPPPF